MAEDLTDYMNDLGLKVQYMHSDIDTLERIEIIQNLRKGSFDILIGINLLREGLDIPECALVAICDADKEGFLDLIGLLFKQLEELQEMLMEELYYMQIILPNL